MTRPSHNKTRHILFLCRGLGGENLRYARAILSLADVTLFVICEQVTGHQAGGGLTRIVRVADARDPDQVARAARRLIPRLAGLDQIVTTTET